MALAQFFLYLSKIDYNPKIAFVEYSVATMAKILEARLFLVHDFVSTSVEHDVSVEPTALLHRQQLFFFATTRSLPSTFIST